MSSSSSRVAEEADILACCGVEVSSGASACPSTTANGGGLKQEERIPKLPLWTLLADVHGRVFIKGLAAYIDEGTELSSSSKRLSTLGRASSVTRPAAPRLGFSSVGGAVLPAKETPFSWIWWMMLLEGSGGAASSVTKHTFLPSLHHSLHMRR